MRNMVPERGSAALTWVNVSVTHLRLDGRQAHGCGERDRMSVMKLAHIALAAVLPFVLVTQAAAQNGRDGNAWLLSLGGKLYDNVWLETGKSPPDGRNPAYPAAIDMVSGNTWRCVSCHGWDYLGRDGHLGRVSSSATFASLRQSAGKPVSEIADKLRSGDHAKMVDSIGKAQVEALALFISIGQRDVTGVVEGGKSKGVALRGKDIFEGACVSCHNADGKAYIEGESGDRPALGWVALNKPEQALHKITNGVPGADMLSLRFLSESQIADLLSYLQTLDTEPSAE